MAAMRMCGGRSPSLTGAKAREYAAGKRKSHHSCGRGSSARPASRAAAVMASSSVLRLCRTAGAEACIVAGGRVVGAVVLGEIVEGRAHVDFIAVPVDQDDVDRHAARMPADAGRREKTVRRQPVHIGLDDIRLQHFPLRVGRAQAVLQFEEIARFLETQRGGAQDDGDQIAMPPHFRVGGGRCRS